MPIRLFTLALLLNIAAFAFGQNPEDALVRKSFDSYKSSILNDKGEEAVKYVDQRTVRYYGNILDLVRTADSAKVANLPLLDKLMVFAVRHRTSREKILSFDGRKLLVYAIESGMVGKNSVANNSVGDVVVQDNFAKGELVVSGQKTPLYFQFYKEEGTWKLDLTSIFPASTMAFRKMVEDSGQDENEFLFNLLKMLTGKAPGSEIWKPVV